MSRIIVPIPKSPHPSGRTGPKVEQDWYQGLVRAAALAREVGDAKILVITAFQAAGEESEASMYLRELKHLAPNARPLWIDRGYETVEQVELLRPFTEARDAPDSEIIVISTFLHYWRVRWLARGMRLRHECVYGTPRFSEVPRDLVLTVLMPVIDLLGLRSAYLRWLKGRREKGTF